MDVASASAQEALKMTVRQHHHHNHHSAVDHHSHLDSSLSRSWFQIILDSSHLITFIVSILVIVYASFKSLRIDKRMIQQAKKEAESSTTGCGGFASRRGCSLSKVDSESGVLLLVEDEERPESLEDDEDDDDDDDDIMGQGGSDESVQTIDFQLALLIPVAASVSLLLMFFFFDSIQTAFVICTSILATVAFSYLFTPVCRIILSWFMSTQTLRRKRKWCFFGKYRLYEVLAFCMSSGLIATWLVTGHWLLMDIIGIGFCITFIAIVRLPSLKVSIMLLAGLVIYDVLWVYFSHLIFSSNVMVKVATREADNPMNFLARKLNFDMKDSPRLSLPGKLVVPSYKSNGNFSILGLGDIVIPGLLLCFVLRFDAYKRSRVYQLVIEEQDEESSAEHVNKNEATCGKEATSGGNLKQPHRADCACHDCLYTNSKTSEHHKKAPKRFFLSDVTSDIRLDTNSWKYSTSSGKPERQQQRHNKPVAYTIRNLIRFERLTYFHCSLVGYFLGLITATLSSEIFREAQPALLFLVPFTLLPLLTMAYIKGDLQLMWNEPFTTSTTTSSKYFYA